MIESPESFAGGRTLMFGVAALFLVVITGTGLIDALYPSPLPKLTGRERVLDEKLRTDAKFSDGSLARLIEHDRRLRSRVRRTVTPPFAWFLYSQLSEAKGVVAGRDGWLFLVSRARPPVLPAELAALRAANQLAALDRLMHTHGTEILAVPVPRKSVILEEMLPRGVTPDRRLEESLFENLRERGVLTADLLSAFSSNDPRELFHVGDTHWTAEAELIAAEETCRAGDLLVAPELRETKLVRIEDGALGFDLFGWFGADFDGRTEPRFQRYRRDRYDVRRRDDHTMLRQREGDEAGSIAIVGTSYSADRSLPYFLSHYSNESVWNAARAGASTATPMREFLLSLGASRWPELLIFEFPMHLILGRLGFEDIATIFSEWSPSQVTPLIGFEHWKAVTLVPTPQRPWSLAAQLPSGWLAHTSDGTAWVRMSAAAPTRPIQLRLDNGGASLLYTWPASRDELVLPLMGMLETSGPIQIFVRGADSAELALDSVEVVAAADVLASYSGRPLSPVSDSDGRWSQRIEFTDSPVVPTHGVLDLALGAAGLMTEVEVEVVFDEGREILQHFAALRASGRAVLGLNGAAGRRLVAVEFRGSGGGKRNACVVEARVLAPLVHTSDD